MIWFYSALLATLLFAIVTLLDDNLLSFVYKSPYLACATAGLYGALPLLARLFIRPSPIPAQLALLAVMAGILNLAYYFFYFKGLDSDTPSVVIALFGLAPATIPFLAYLMVGERLTATEIVGLVIVLFASLGLAATDVKHLKFSKALIPVAIAVVFLDAVSIMTKYIYQRSDFYAAYLFFALGMGLGGLIFYLTKLKDNNRHVRDISKSLKKLLPVFVLVELTALTAEVTMNFAISRGPVSLVRVIEGTQAMIVLFLALGLYSLSPRFFREAEAPGIKNKVLFMLAIIVGLAVISSSRTT